MKKKREFNIFSLLWTLLLHTAVVGLLLLLHLNKPVAQAESGVPVLLGNMGNLDTDYEFTEVNSMPAPASSTVPVPAVAQAEPVITQNLEETVVIESGEKEKPVTPTETVKQPTPEEIQAEQERLAQERVNNNVTNAFNRSGTMQSTSETDDNTDDQGNPGSLHGNSTQGATIGIGGAGPVVGLDGREVLELSYPSNENIPDEAMVVVNIKVDPEGNVISATISNRTRTTNNDLRQRSINAAKKTKFNAAPSSVMDAQGTITYFYQFKKGVDSE